MTHGSRFVPEPTADGSFTFFSPDFHEAFHSRAGGKLEAELKFIQPTHITEKARQPVIRLLDVCYGLGYNTAAALETIWAVNPECRVEWIGLELDREVPQTAIAHQLLSPWPAPIPDLLAELVTVGQVQGDRFQAQVLWGDARQTIQQVYQRNFLADAIFLDPFSPRRCPQLWTVEFLGWVARCLKPDGWLATYSCAAAVRTALLQVGLHVGSIPDFSHKSPGTLAGHPPADLPPLLPHEVEHLKTRAAIPYRDPSLSDAAETIVARRHQEQRQSTLESTSQWRRRWLAAQAESGCEPG
ncbi:MAG: MnmC family methyltransferase [Synechococcales bacterium]|nr:MnmC family methyltransferase [Synechococcales bacterium]